MDKEAFFSTFHFSFAQQLRSIWLVILKAGAALLLTATSLDEWPAKFCDTIPEICSRVIAIRLIQLSRGAKACSSNRPVLPIQVQVERCKSF